MTITHLAVYRGMTVSVCFLQKKSKNDQKKANGVKENDNQEEMKESKAVHVTNHKIRENQDLVYQLYRSERDTAIKRCDSRTNFSCQYDSKKDNEICTCKNVVTIKKHQYIRQYSGMPKQIYAYHGSRSFTDVGVGSIKTLSRKKVKRVYLPETDDIGVGSSELSYHIFRKSRYPKVGAVNGSFYDHKKTSSKCVGGILEYNTGCVINEKLSPIIQTKSGSTSPKISVEVKNNETGSNTVEKIYESIGIQFETERKEKIEIDDTAVEVSAVRIKPVKKLSEQTQKSKFAHETPVDKKNEELEKKAKDADKTFSSDSLVQHVYNLENPSDEKHSKTSLQDPMENKLEREYRKMFSPKKSKESNPSCQKPIPTFKSTSVLKRRFEALRRGLVRKNDSNTKTEREKTDTVIIKTSTHESLPSHKDVSITSDPPSLIARSISNSKKYSPALYDVERDRNTTPSNVNDKYGIQWPHTETESESQGVKGMFKLWGKKFNFEDEMNPKKTSQYETIKKSDREIKVTKSPSNTKKENKKFFFFKKKSKDKNNDAYKPKKDVTAGRCEIRDGLTLRLGGTSTPKVKVSNISEEDEEITRKAWLRRFLTPTIESARSVNVRWNNSMYATSSSTIFELLDTVYKNTAVVLRSRSEITTEDSSLYKSYTKHKVNFVQDIEAWMIPKTVPDNILRKQIPIKIHSNKEIKERNIEVTISDQKWYIDKSEAFSHKIQLILHSKNFPKSNNNQISSGYLKIDIPHDFFDASNDKCKPNQSSEEEVFKIVEYETNSEFRRGKNATKTSGKGDHTVKDINVIVSVEEIGNLDSHNIEKVIKESPGQRDVVIQGSNVNIPKRCDVIGVRIITQRDLREFINPSLKIQDDITDDESNEVLPVQKKCEFAESYLHEYYRQLTPLGIDLPSWCVSDTNLKSSSEKSIASVHNLENNSKACPNIYDDCQVSSVSSNPSAFSYCAYEDQCVIKEECFSAKLFKRKKDSKGKLEKEDPNKRKLPKDSLEVFKRRKMYAASAKSQWAADSCSASEDRPVCVPSIESKGAQNTTTTSCPRDKSILRSRKKTCKKHVSLPDCETMNSLLNKQLAETLPEGILQFKGAATGCEACKKKGSKCSKHAVVCPQPSCEIPQPPCKISCEEMKNPPCSKPHSPSCNVTPRSISSDGIPFCQKPTLPPSCVSNLPSKCVPPQQSPCSPSPCPASLPPCAKSPNKSSSKTPTTRTCSPCGASSCSKLSTPQPCPKISQPSCNKHSIPKIPDSSPHCSPPPCKSPPVCTKPSPPPKRKPSPPSCKNKPPPLPCAKPSKTPSPRKKKKSRSPCKKPSPKPCSPPLSKPPTPPCPKTTSPPCEKPSPPCKKPSPLPCAMPSPPPCPCTTPSSPPCKRPLSCRTSALPSITRCSQPRPCPATNPPPCPGKTCPKTPPPCKKSRSRPRCKKFFKPAPCSANPSECCHDYSSCDVSRQSKTSHDSSCSSQISLPANSPYVSQKNSQQKISPCAPKKAPTPPKNFRAGPGSKTGLLMRKCPTPPVKKPPKRLPCKLPPCDQYRTPTSPKDSRNECQQKPSEEYPWPMNSQTSCQPSPKRGNSSNCPPVEQKKSSNQCDKTCSMQQLPPKERDCRTDCANQKKAQQKRSKKDCIEDTCYLEPPNCPQPEYPEEPKRRPCPPIGTDSKVTGIFLKMRPSRKKTCSDDCRSWEFNEELQGIIKLSSHENITISLKHRSASTDEIRECGDPKHYKMQDEDGKTLYERKDYNCAQHRPSVLGDMYRDSKINRVSAPIAVNNLSENGEKELSCKSDRSIANSIEIQFKLRISQGDKTTEINIGNDNEGKPDTKTHVAKAAPEVYVVKSGTEKNREEADPKNDINIKIIVRNFKPKHKNIEGTQHDDEYSKKISDKFHTVSTGYSDVTMEPNEDNIVSIHRTAVDLCSSAEGSNTQMKICNEEANKGSTQSQPNITVSLNSIEQVPTDVTEDEYNELKSISSKKDSQSEQNYETNTNESELPDFNETDEQDAALLDCDTSNECNVDSVMSKHASKELKKGLLKKIFHKANTIGKDKKTVRQLRDMLKIILTDSSDNDARNVTSNELEKDVKCAPIKSNYFKDSASMNNYYNLESTLSSLRNTKIATIYPSDEQRSVTSKSSGTDMNDAPFQGCICSKVAKKLNQSQMNVSCCCRQKVRKDEETNCDLRNAEDLFLLNYRTEYVDVETQHSKYLSSKVNSLNVSIHSKNTSFIKTTKETKVVEQLQIINRPKVKNRVAKTFSPHKSHNRDSELIMFNQNPAFGISNKDNENSKKLSMECNNKLYKRDYKRDYDRDYKTYKEADILQSYEAKKAVLEIYAEKAENGGHYVAKLPKFVYDKESEISRNYEQIATNSYKSVCKQNIVMMSIQR